MIIKNKGMYPYRDNQSVIEYILENRGINKKDMGKYLFPDESLKPDVWKLDNIHEGLELLKKHVDEKNNILINYDMDLDGFSSGSLIYQFIKHDLELKSTDFNFHLKKIHGIDMKIVKEKMPDLLIVPDAASSDFNDHKELKELGIDILIIDHHLVDENRYSDDALVINNQLSDEFESKGMTGSSLVYLFCEAYVEKYDLDIDVNKYADLSATGMIADRASFIDTGVFYFAMTQLKEIHNPFIKQIIKKSSNLEEGKGLSPTDIGFHVAPLINALSRQGNYDNLKIVLDAYSGEDYSVYNKRLKIECSVVEEALRKANNTKRKQKEVVDEAMEQIEERIKEKGSDEHKVLLVNSTGIINDSGVNGLVAIKLAEKYKKPTLVMQYHEDEQMLLGSMRNFNNSPIDSLKDVLNDTELIECKGHDNAGGVFLPLDNAMDIIPTLNEKLKHIEYDNATYYVDLSYSGTVNADEIMDIAEHDYMWGEDLNKPLIHVSNIVMEKKNLKFIGKKGNSWKLDNLGACDAVMFNLTEEQKLMLTNHETDSIEIELIGEAGLNTWNNQKRPQLIIKDFDVKPYTGSPWGNFDIESAVPF